MNAPGGSVDPAAGRLRLALYAVVRLVVMAVARMYWRLETKGLHNVPADGPFILAPVHRSIVDTFVVATVTRRRLRYMGKAELWKHDRAGWLLSTLGGFPVHRGGADREALRRCVEVIDHGEPLVIFPEGTRRSGDRVEDLYEGAAYVAARTGVPIVPVGLAGTESIMPKGSKWIRPGRVRLVVGEPLAAPAGGDGGRAPRRAVKECTEQLEARLQSLYDEAAGRS